MGRNKKARLIQMAPNFAGFKPQGLQGRYGPDVSVTFEEYEALNLCDYDLLTQSEAAKMMKVSRPTFTRIYESARRKIAKAFIEGSSICFEQGYSVSEWLVCSKCQIKFTIVSNGDKSCPLCKSELITNNLYIMIIGIASSEDHLKSSIDPHFGKCDWFCIYDTENKTVKFLENSLQYQHEHAGTEAAEKLIKLGVKLVIAGRFGSKVIDIFNNNNIQMVIPQTGQTISAIILKCTPRAVISEVIHDGD